jgi:hypothetical protein
VVRSGAQGCGSQVIETRQGVRSVGGTWPGTRMNPGSSPVGQRPVDPPVPLRGVGVEVLAAQDDLLACLSVPRSRRRNRGAEPRDLPPALHAAMGVHRQGQQVIHGTVLMTKRPVMAASCRQSAGGRP